MKNKTPLVSIITVSYNSEKTIEKTILSVNEQTYLHIEHVFIDGNSSDNTVNIINQKSKRKNIVLCEPDDGIYDAMNKGIDISNGDIVGFLNADDYLFSKNIVNLIVHQFNASRVECVYGNINFIDTNGKIKRKWRSRDFESGLFSRSWTPAHPTFYSLKKNYIIYGKYKTNFKIASDVDLMLRFLEIHKLKSQFVNEVFVEMLTGGESTKSIFSTITIYSEVKKSHLEYNLEFNSFKYLFFKAIKYIRQKTFF